MLEDAVKRLEKVQDTKISIDLTELKSVLSNHEMVLKNQISNLHEKYNKFEKLLKEAKIYPTWAVVLFIVSLVLNCIGVTIILFF